MLKASLSIILCLGLIACDPSRINNKKLETIVEKKICFFDAGGTFGRAGVRARQFVGKGPKMRVVQWKTPEFKDDFQIVQNTNLNGTKPNIAVLLSWRVNIQENNVESSLESLEATAINIPNIDAHGKKYWRLDIFDGEKFTSDVSSISTKEIHDVFSTEGKGIIIPNHIGEALGGVNGSRFLISLVDENDAIIVKREIFPPKGYEFKANVKSAFQGLEILLQNPEKCSDPTTQLRTD